MGKTLHLISNLGKLREQQLLNKKNPLRNHDTDEAVAVLPPSHSRVLLKVQLQQLKWLVNIQLTRKSMPSKHSKKTTWKEYYQISQKTAPPAAITHHEN